MTALVTDADVRAWAAHWWRLWGTDFARDLCLPGRPVRRRGVLRDWTSHVTHSTLYTEPPAFLSEYWTRLRDELYTLHCELGQRRGDPEKLRATAWRVDAMLCDLATLGAPDGE